jgi:hypothetical protein
MTTTTIEKFLRDIDGRIGMGLRQLENAPHSSEVCIEQH